MRKRSFRAYYSRVSPVARGQETFGQKASTKERKEKKGNKMTKREEVLHLKSTCFGDTFAPSKLKIHQPTGEKSVYHLTLCSSEGECFALFGQTIG